MKIIQMVGYNCEGYFKHTHKRKLVATLCHFLQSKLPMSKIEFYYLKWFKPEIYFKKLHALKGSNKRALIRRGKKGMRLI